MALPGWLRVPNRTNRMSLGPWRKRTARGSDLWLETRQTEEARSNPAGFHVYVVDNVRQGNPNLFGFIDLHGDVLAGLLQRAKPASYVTVPFPVAVYDAAIAHGDEE